MTPPVPRLDWAPIEIYARNNIRGDIDQFPADLTDVTIGEACGLKPNQIWVARVRGITWILADRTCCALGIHPSLVFGPQWWTLMEHLNTIETPAVLARREYQRQYHKSYNRTRPPRPPRPYRDAVAQGRRA